MRRRRRRRRRRRLERSEGEFGERVRSGALLESGEEKERERERERKRKEERGKRKEGARDVSKRRVIGNRKHWREMTLDGERKEKRKKEEDFVDVWRLGRNLCGPHFLVALESVVVFI